MPLRTLLAATTCFITLSSCISHVDSDHHFSSFRQLRRHLDEVPSAYSPVPLWIWNGTVTKREIDIQLSGFNEMGFGGVFIYPVNSNSMACQASADSNLLDYARRKARWLGLDLQMCGEQGCVSGFKGISLLRNSFPELHAEELPGTGPATDSGQPHLLKAYMVISEEDSSTVVGSAAGPQWDLMLFRELNSIANQLGIIRRLADPFRGQQGELHLMDIKRLADRSMALGINMPGRMPSLHNLTGNMKYLSAPSFSFHASCRDEYSVMSEYIGRLSLALSAGEQHNKTLVLVPGNTSGWNSPPDMAPGIAHRTADEFRRLLGLLDGEQIGYDLGNEAIIAAHGSVFNEFFVVGQREYNYVVIPQMMLSVPGTTADLLEEYLENGGVVIALCDPPRYIDGAVSDRLEHWPAIYADQWLTMSGCNDPRLIQYLYSNELLFNELQGGELVHMRRQLDDGQLLFFANYSSTEMCSASMISSGADMAHIDLFSGAIEQYPCVITDEIASFSFTLKPAESILLFLSQHEIKGKSPRTRRWTGDGVPVITTDMVVTVQDPNVLKLDYGRLLTETDTTAFTHFFLLQQLLQFQSIQMITADTGQTTSKVDLKPTASAVTLEYKFLADAQCRSKEIQLVVERPDLFSVSLNGTPLQRLDGEWWLDRAFGVYSVEGLLVPGENRVELKVDTIPEHCAIQPVYLRGNFDVLPLDKGWLLAPAGQRNTGSWKELGLPFYGGRMTYSATFLINDPVPVRVRLNEWSGTVATVEVNGSDAGVILAPNRDLRLDKRVRSGSNKITVTVKGSLNNLLWPHRLKGPSEMLTLADLLNAPVEQPSGMQYDLDDYGLFEPFIVEVMR